MRRLREAGAGGEVEHRLDAQPVLERRAVLRLAPLVRPFEHGDARAGGAPRLLERPERLVGLVQHVAEEHEVERAIGERQRLGGARLEPGGGRVLAREGEQRLVRIDADHLEARRRERLGEDAAAGADVEHARPRQPFETELNDAGHLETGEALVEPETRGIAVEPAFVIVGIVHLRDHIAAPRRARAGFFACVARSRRVRIGGLCQLEISVRTL